MIEDLGCKKEDLMHFLRHFSNGITHILILWIISRGRIHGYGIMSKLDEFFEYQIQNDLMKKTSASKIYPILNRFENGELIKGDWEEKDNKQVKYYEITEKGEKVLDFIRNKPKLMTSNNSWKEFFDDMKAGEA